MPKLVATIQADQIAMAAQLAQLREQVRVLEERTSLLAAELAAERTAAAEARETQAQMREEVRGLYVETSSVKGDIATLGEQVQSVSASFANFRYSSGVLIAILIVLQVVAVTLVLRGRA